jgi:hypothetical protein
MPSEPLLVPLGALAFYLFDSLLMLYGDEALLVATGRSGWQCTGGSSWLLAGRRVALPNPFLPWQPLWRLVHRPEPRGVPGRDDDARRARATLATLRVALRPLGVLVTLLQWLMLPGLALVLLLLGTGNALLVMLALIYALVLASGAVVIVCRSQLQLARGAAWALAAEGLLCPPFAINLVRKVTLRRPLRDDAIGLATALGGALAGDVMRAQLARDEVRDEAGGP